MWNKTYLRLMEDRDQISSHEVRALPYQASQRAAKRAKPHQTGQLSRLNIKHLKCGIWDYHGNRLAFTPFFQDTRPGTFIFGTQQAVILLQDDNADEQRIYCQYHTVEDIFLGSYDQPTITIKLRVAPKFYKVAGKNDLAAMMGMTLGGNTESDQKKKLRLTSLDHAHSRVVGTCFVYQVALDNHFEISNVRSLLSRNPRIPTTTTLSTLTLPPTQSLDDSFNLLNHDLTDQYRYGQLP